MRTYVRSVYCCSQGHVNAFASAGEEAADCGVRSLRLLLEEEVAGALDGDDFGAAEAFAQAGENPAGEDALVGCPEDKDGGHDAAAVDGLLSPHISERLVNGVAGALDAQRAAVGFEDVLRCFARVVELAAEDAASEEAPDQPEDWLD